MKSEIKPKTSKSLVYPCLLQGIDDDKLVVLAIGPAKEHRGPGFFAGTVVSPPRSNTKYGLGTYSDDWILSCFKPYEGSVTLTSD